MRRALLLSNTLLSAVWDLHIGLNGTFLVTHTETSPHDNCARLVSDLSRLTFEELLESNQVENGQELWCIRCLSSDAYCVDGDMSLCKLIERH